MLSLKFNLKKLSLFFDNNTGDTRPSVLDSNGLPFAYFETLDSNLSEEATVDLLLFYLNDNNITNAETLADYLITNALPFYDRASIVSEQPVTEGIIPTVSLKFVYALYLLYQKTEKTKYLTEYTRIITQLETDGTVSGSLYSSAILPAVLIYNNGEFIDKRYGSYVSDILPSVWNAISSSTKESETFGFIKASQEAFNSNYSNTGLFYPYYVNNLSENSPYGTAGTWVFDGVIGNELNFIHQYKTFLNLAIYYNYQFKKGEVENYYLKSCIDKFFNLIYAIGSYPEEISLEQIDFTTETISFNNNTVSFTTIGSDVLSWTDTPNLKNLVIFAKACLLLYEVENKQKYLTIVEDIIEELLLHEQSNFSYKNDTYTSIGLQINILDLFVSYNNLIRKNYYNLMNDALNLLNLDEITPANYATHQQKEIIRILKNSVNELWGEEEYIELVDLSEIPDYIEPRWYMVLKYHMAWQLALTREHGLAVWFEEKYMQMYALMKQRNDLDLILENQMPYSIDYSVMNSTNIWGNLYA